MNTKEAIATLKTLLSFARHPSVEATAFEHAIEVMKASEWQLIESAPRDGTEILAFEYPSIMVMRFERNKWEQADAQNSEWDTDEQSPTHWMPLPKPPQGEE
jgi:hypothetical protein